MPNYAQQKKTRSLHRRKILLLTFLVIIFLGGLNIFLSAQVSHIGLDLKELNAQALSIRTDISRLKKEVNQNSSLVTIRSKASNMGFVPEYQAIVLPKTEPVAYQPN